MQPGIRIMREGFERFMAGCIMDLHEFLWFKPVYAEYIEFPKGTQKYSRLRKERKIEQRVGYFHSFFEGVYTHILFGQKGDYSKTISMSNVEFVFS